MNGAVQGEATSTASTPVAKLPRRWWPSEVAHGLRVQQRAPPRDTSNAPQQVQPDPEKQRSQQRDHQGACTLKAPAQLRAPGAQRDQYAGQQHEARHRTGGKGEPVSAQRRIAAMAVLHQRQQLQRQHREHAGHQVQDQAPEKKHSPAPAPATIHSFAPDGATEGKARLGRCVRG